MSAYDVIVVGSGPGGYVSAIRAAQLGLKTAVVEQERVGGVCLNWGCIPTKAMLEAALDFRSAEKCIKYGIEMDKSRFSYSEVHKESRKASELLANGIKHLFEKNKIDLYSDSALLTSSGDVYLKTAKTRIEAKNVLIATGSRERELPGLPFDGDLILRSKDILALKEMPKTIAIIGAGAIGVEFSQIFNTFGAKVTLIEMMPSILPLEDEEMTSELEKALASEGITILKNAKVENMGRTPKGCELIVAQGGGPARRMKIAADKVLVAVGRQANIEGLGLEDAGIIFEKGYIATGDYYLTARKGFYAVGDVIGQALLAHAASSQGLIAINHIVKGPSAGIKRLDADCIPRAVYCEPQIASFGLTEKSAKSRGFDFAVGRFPFVGCGKAVAAGKTKGKVKILVDRMSKEILGASILGENATELIHELLLSKSSELVPEDIIKVIHAHPTYSEAILEASKAVFGQPIHL